MSEAPDRLRALSALPAPLPDWPTGWYVVARSFDLPPGGVRAVRIDDAEIVVFRTASGQLAAIDAHCPHMGANLAHGTVSGETLRCALHCWTIGVDGDIAGRRERSRAWPVREQYGLVLVDFGSGVTAPRSGDTDFAWIGMEPQFVAVSWHALMVNAFDMPHLETVHRRSLLATPEVTAERGRWFSLRYLSRVTGRGLSDQLMKWLSGDRIDVRLTCHGTILTGETNLGFTRTGLFVGMMPAPGGTRVHAAFGIRRGPLLSLRLALARWLFAAFLRRDIDIVEGMRLRTDVDDATLQSLFEFLRVLRRAPR